MSLGSRNPANVARRVDRVPIGTRSGAAKFGEVVILAVPFGAVHDTVRAIGPNALMGKILVDATNPIADSGGWALGFSTSGAEELAKLVPGARVVKAFNTVFASNQADPKASDQPIDGFVAGDDADAKAQVLELVESIGLKPLDVGPLSAARYLEGMAFINIGLNAQNGWDWTSAWHLDR